MIKLKSLMIIENIDEAKKLNLDNVEDAAEFMIRQTWKIMPKEDRYSEYQVFMWLDNEVELQDKKEKFGVKFFPNEKYPTDRFTDIISKKLEQFEKEKNDRITKKVNPNDPLFVLKNIVRRKTFEGAKQSLMKNYISGWAYHGGRIVDDDAEQAFNRLYKNAMGETVYSDTSSNRYGRLSDIRKIPLQVRGEDNIIQYSINIFIDYYAGRNVDRFLPQVKVYRGVNNPTLPIRPGDYVTFDKEYASSYMRGKFGSIISNILQSKDLIIDKIDPDSSEMVYWPEGHQIKKYEGHIPTFKEFWYEVNSW